MTKYIGPKTDGENVATQADVGGSALSDDTPDALTPDQAGAAGTAVAAARADHQHEILAASAGTITGTSGEGSSNSFARADHDHSYGAGSIPQSALALGPTYETSLPGSPVDGQEIYYQDTGQMATDGIVWHLRYRSGGGTYKWEFVGGGVLRQEENTGRSLTNDTSYTDVPTDTLVITLPLAGEYLVWNIVQITIPAGAGRAGYHAFAITDSSNSVQTEATDNLAAIGQNPTSDGQWTATLSRQSLFTITTAGWKIRERARVAGNYTITFSRRRVFVTPVRLG